MGEPLVLPERTGRTGCFTELFSFQNSDLLTTQHETHWGQNRSGAANNFLDMAEMGTTGLVLRVPVLTLLLTLVHNPGQVHSLY